VRTLLSPTDPARDADFRRFWLGETVSLLGSQVTTLALPLTAILVLDAGPAEIGLLGAASFLPFLLFGLPAGAWIDRRRRRPVLIAANAGRAILIGLVPLAAVLGALRFELLAVIAFLVGVLSVAFEVGYLAYVPRLVGPDRLLAANARLSVSASAAEVGGPGLAGLLIGALSAPFALVVDAASYVVSAVSLASIRHPEPALPGDGAARPGILHELREGLRTVFGHRVVRVLAAEAATFNVFNQVFVGVLLLHATGTLGLDAPTVGAMLSIGSIGALLGSLTAAPIARRLGLGRALVAMMMLACSMPLLVPLVGGPPHLAAAAIALIFAFEGFGIAVTVVNVISLRQAVTPDGMLARMNATYRTLGYGMIPLGALLGGLLGELIGLRATLVVGAIGMAAAPLWVVFSPVPRIRSLADVAMTTDQAEPRVAPSRAPEVEGALP
jgi:MFS family permease